MAKSILNARKVVLSILLIYFIYLVRPITIFADFKSNFVSHNISDFSHISNTELLDGRKQPVQRPADGALMGLSKTLLGAFSGTARIVEIFTEKVSDDVIEAGSPSNGNINVSLDNLNSEDGEIECKIPSLNPLDPTILRYIKKAQPFKCKNVQPSNLFYVNDQGFVIANSTNLELLEELHEGQNFSCHATLIDKTIGEDRKINRSLGRTNISTGSDRIPIVSDAVEVQCNILRHVVDKDGNQTEKLEKHSIYYDVFGHPRNLSRKILSADDKFFSVHLMFTDSTSMSMFERTLNKTFQFLINRLNMLTFPGFNKAGDNTFPNVLAMLTGKRAYNADKDQPCQLEGKYSTMFYDDWNYIWNNFSKKGYATSFNEDVPQRGLFHYLSRGFKFQPVDHFYFPFWWAIKEAKTGSDSNYCFRNRPRAHRQLDVFKREVIKYRNRRHFAYLFQTEFSHDSITDLGKYDDYYFDYFKKFSEQGYFDDKLIFVLSDHGHRFSDIRSTLIGLLEERLPMLGIIVPPKFCSRYSTLCNNLKYNQDKLVTPFDIHETLLDISEANYASEQRDQFERNLSLLYPIPSNRSCKSAGIPKFHCTCQNSKPIDVNDDVVQNASIFATTNLNNMLRAHGNECAELSFRKVIHAERLQNKNTFNEKTELSDSHPLASGIHSIRISYDVIPSNAQFETLIQFDAKGKYSIEGDTSRLSKYGNQCHCINDHLLEKYCFCKDLI